MKIVPKNVVNELERNFPSRWVEAMINDKNAERVLSFIEKYPTLKLSYTEVFFSPEGVALYQNNNEKRLFNLPTQLFDISPIRENDSRGDWQEWLKKATKIKEYK